MPTIMRSIDQIMADAKRDMFFVQFGTSPFDFDRDHPSRKRHFDWFKNHGLRWETAAPRCWLEGDPGIHAVHFDGPDDARVALYEAEFEDGTGKSLSPDAYQMYVIPYASWLEKRGTSGEEDWLDEDGVP
ncbi:hypothetical protein GCM10009416_14710 [Craurococcus roseus]|uniref:Uncharacterized protein n=1 Tax=Craurococcus roseus TaxID=77585 RepID=A0ABN1EXZ6_9PROT